MLRRIYRIVFNVGGLILIIIGLPGIADNIKGWQTWFEIIVDLIALEPTRTILFSVGIVMIVAVNTPRRFWRFLGQKSNQYFFQPIFILVTTLRNVTLLSSARAKVQGVLRPEVRSYLFRPRDRVASAINDPVLELNIDFFATLPMSYGGMELKVENTVLSPLEEHGIKRIPQSVGYWASFDVPAEIARGQASAELHVVADDQIWKSELFTIDFDRVSEVNDTFFTH